MFIKKIHVPVVIGKTMGGKEAEGAEATKNVGLLEKEAIIRWLFQIWAGHMVS